MRETTQLSDDKLDRRYFPVGRKRKRAFWRISARYCNPAPGLVDAVANDPQLASTKPLFESTFWDLLHRRQGADEIRQLVRDQVQKLGLFRGEIGDLEKAVALARHHPAYQLNCSDYLIATAALDTQSLDGLTLLCALCLEAWHERDLERLIGLDHLLRHAVQRLDRYIQLPKEDLGLLREVLIDRILGDDWKEVSLTTEQEGDPDRMMEDLMAAQKTSARSVLQKAPAHVRAALDKSIPRISTAQWKASFPLVPFDAVLQNVLKIRAHSQPRRRR